MQTRLLWCQWSLVCSISNIPCASRVRKHLTFGISGMGPEFCAPGNCTSSCDQKSECDPGWGAQWSQAENCPLNVCCSKYGFCGQSPRSYTTYWLSKENIPPLIIDRHNLGFLWRHDRRQALLQWYVVRRKDGRVCTTKITAAAGRRIFKLTAVF